MIAKPLIGTAIVVTLDEIVTKSRAPAPRIYIGIAFVFVMLSLFDDAAPQIVSPLAWLVFLSIFIMRGPALWQRIGKTF